MTIQTLRVLTYHRVLDGAAAAACNPSLISATPAVFEEQVRHLAKRYRVVSGEEVVAAYQHGRRLPERAVLVTFDDGYRDVGEIAWPILRKFGLTATVFVPTGFVDSPRRFWWDRLFHAISGTAVGELELPGVSPLPLSMRDRPARVATLRLLQQRIKVMQHPEAMALVDRLCEVLHVDGEPPNAVLGWNELRELASDGMTLGAHTRTHPVLTRVPSEDAVAEIAGSREDLLRETGTSTPIFAYPFGAHDGGVIEATRQAGLGVAVTCLDGHNRIPAGNPLRLYRTNITPRTTMPVFRVRLSWIGPHVDRLRHGTGMQALSDRRSRHPGTMLRVPEQYHGWSPQGGSNA